MLVLTFTMGWLASLFSSRRARNGQTINSTIDAFSIPSSSPINNNDTFNPDSFTTPDSAMSPSVYTYPPQGPASYSYVPTPAGHSRPTSESLLPTHMDPLHTPLSPSNTYPPLQKTWARIRAWLSREYPELGDTLNYGILPQDLQQLEMQFGFALPTVVRESYLCCDGQEAESAAGCSEGLFFGLTLLPLEDVYEEWRFWREVDSDPATGANPRLKEVMQSIPPKWVRREYSQRGWIPLVADKAGNYIGVDMNPAEAGQIGQVIVFGRDFDTKVVFWRGDGHAGWAKWLAAFVEDLESGEGFELGPAEISDDSEDELGYESYFYDGKGRGQGDGGGDTGGVAGLRLTGEYRGWSIMEAWADRSLKKWHEVGLLADVPLLPPEDDYKGKGIDKVGLGVLDVNHGSGAEVPIPVLAVEDEPTPPSTARPRINGQQTSSDPFQNVPSISVTKPPAPLPVALPTAQDIEEPSSPSLSFDEDLESGHGRGMREVAQQQHAPSPRRQIPQPIEPIPHGAAEFVDVTSPAADITMPLIQASIISDPLINQRIPDLLVNTEAVLKVNPVEASASGTPAPISAGQSLGESPKLVEAAELSVEPGAQQEEEEAQPETTTIRLIGGGGSAGLVTEEDLSEEPVQVESVSPTQEVNEASAQSTASSDNGKVHKKTKSGLAGLKRFSQFGRKDSTSSIKDSNGV